MNELTIILDKLRKLLETMSAEERVDAFDEIREGYCLCCGYECSDDNCYCWNDE